MRLMLRKEKRNIQKIENFSVHFIGMHHQKQGNPSQIIVYKFFTLRFNFSDFETSSLTVENLEENPSNNVCFGHN